MRISTIPEWAVKPTVGFVERFQVADLFIECAFADPADVQCANFDDIVQIEPFLQIGHNGIGQQGFHFTRHAGQGDDHPHRLPLSHRERGSFHDESRGGADRIFNDDGAFGDVSLAFLVLGGGAPIPGDAGDDLFPEFRVKFERRTGGVGDGLAGGVIHGWAKAAGGDDDVGALQGCPHGFGNAPGIIPDRLGAVQVHAQAAQGLRDEAGVGVGGLAEQEFGADGNDLCGWHGWIIFLKFKSAFFCRKIFRSIKKQSGGSFLPPRTVQAYSTPR